MSKKIFILRTSSLVSKENGTLCFGNDNEIVIPMTVLDELERLSKQFNAKGRNAKNVLNYLASFKTSELMSANGVIQKNGSTLRLLRADSRVNIPFKDELNLNSFDLKCFQIACQLKQENPKKPVILISRNSSLRIKANSIGIKAQNFKDELFPNLDQQYTGRVECTTSDQAIDSFYSTGKLKKSNILNNKDIEWVANEFFLIKSNYNCDSTCKSAIGRFNGRDIVPLIFSESNPYGITAKNVGQIMMIEALMHDSYTAPIVIIKGGAGTGKTYTSLAVALEKTLSENVYSQILVTSPTQTIGQEKLGFLPGEIEDKFNPHLGGIKDNIRLLYSSKKFSEKKPNKKTGESLFNDGIIRVQPIGFLRGRTIVDTFFIIDETQNIDPDDIKSIVSRAGQGSKFVFLGDPTQIDNPSLNERYNGLIYLSEKMKNSPLAWQITLKDEESVRSDLARLAAKIL